MTGEVEGGRRATEAIAIDDLLCAGDVARAREGEARREGVAIDNEDLVHLLLAPHLVPLCPLGRGGGEGPGAAVVADREVLAAHYLRGALRVVDFN